MQDPARKDGSLSINYAPYKYPGGGGTLHMKGVGMLIGNFELQCTVVNLNGWSSSRKCYFELFMYVGFSWECQGALRVLARSDNHTFTFFLADENDLFLFQAEKRQQVCETGQRLHSLESGLRRQQHYILGIFWNLFIVLYSGILTRFYCSLFRTWW